MQPKQLDNNSLMGSSAGFNRKIKITRPGSRDQKLKTGEIFPQFQDPLATNPFNLQTLNLYQDENTFISSMKVELMQLQEEINKIDLDGKIRNIDPRQEYRLQQLKKWVAQNAQFNIKQQFDKLNQIDLNQLLTVLDVRTQEDAIIKLYKFIVIMDTMILKLTEYESIHLIKFDELFTQLCTNYNDNLQSINPLKFNVSFANLNRMAELYQIKKVIDQPNNQQPNKIEKIDNTPLLLKQIKQKDDQIAELNKTIKQLQQIKALNQGNDQAQKQQIDQAQKQQFDQAQKQQFEEELQKYNYEIKKHQSTIEDLQNQIAEYQKQMNWHKIQSENVQQQHDKQIQELISRQQEDLINQRKQIEEKQRQQPQQVQQPQAQQTAKDHNYYQRILDKQVADASEKIKQLENELLKLRTQVTDKQAIIEGQEREIQQWKETIDRLNKVKDEIYQQFQKRYSTNEQFSNSYEAALKLEFDTMKKAFEQKIQKYQQDLEHQKRDGCRQLNELRIQLEREQETKKLLMNKLSLYI